MLLVAGTIMVSGAVRGCDLSHTFTHRLTCFPTHWPHGWHTCSSVLPQTLKAGRQLCSSSSSVTQQDSNMDNWQGSQHKTWSRHKLQVAALIYSSMVPLSKLCSRGEKSFSLLVKCQFCSFYSFKYMFSFTGFAVYQILVDIHTHWLHYLQYYFCVFRVRYIIII